MSSTDDTGAAGLDTSGPDASAAAVTGAEATVAPEEVTVVTESDARIRRAPKYSVFIIVGGVLGLIATFIATSLFPVDPLVGFGALLGYFSLYGVTAGVLIGALLALIIDRVTLRRARPATIRLTTVGNPGDVVVEPARDDAAPRPASE